MIHLAKQHAALCGHADITPDAGLSLVTVAIEPRQTRRSPIGP